MKVVVDWKFQRDRLNVKEESHSSDQAFEQYDSVQQKKN